MAKEEQKRSIWELVVCLILVVPMLWGLHSCCNNRAEKPKRPTKESAWTYAQSYVTQYLKSPSTADFGSWRQSASRCVKDDGDGLVTVRGWVDSQNSFGATMRTHFVVRLQFMAHSGTWELLGMPEFK